VIEAWKRLDLLQLDVKDIVVFHTEEQALPELEKIHEGQIGARAHEGSQRVKSLVTDFAVWIAEN
jgi:hypothetical protein